MATTNICKAEELKDGEGLKFSFARDGVSFEGFVVRKNDAFFAYENRCRHLPLPLDYGDGQFFTPDKKYIICSSHGAMYELKTGKCVQGPCAGASLKPMKLTQVGDELVVEIEETESNTL